MSNLEKRAKHFAIRWHDSIDQVRKYTGEPYWRHPEAVAALVKTVPHTEEMVAAAWLHDVVEDTPCTIAQVAEEVGELVAGYVEWLTDRSKPSDGNRAERKAVDRMRLSLAPIPVKTVKLADLIDNSRSILARDPDFARVYILEKRMLLDEALRAGDQTLWAQADEITRTALAG